MSERKRSPNWNMQEKILLLDLVEEHFSVVENKKTDGVTMKQKNAEWVKISEEFNAQTMFGHRTADNLKAQWESLKKSTKKEASAARQSLIQTGGGPAKPKSSDPLFTKIMGLISTAVIGLQNEFDSDRISNYEIIEEDSHNMSASVKLSEVTDIYIPKTSNSLPHTITSSDPQETIWKSLKETLSTGVTTPQKCFKLQNLLLCS